MTVADKLARQGPRKLLALDGGGIRGLITIEVLAELERVLREESDAGEEFVLADYFDYVAGTSTGAVIATCLSVGISTSARSATSTSRTRPTCSTRRVCSTVFGSSTRTIAWPRGCDGSSGRRRPSAAIGSGRYC